MSFTHIPNWQKDVFAEASLSRVLKASWGVVGSKHDFWLTAGLCSVGILIAALSVFVWQNAAGPGLTARIMQSWSIVAGGFGAAILGFLIAGFSIFAAMTDKALFHELAQIKSDGRDISDFKFIFYNFLYVFVHYLAFSIASIAICFLFVPDSPLWYVARIIYEFDGFFIRFIVLISAVLFGSYTFYILLLLRSFIWSMYQSLLIAIFAGLDEEADEN